jgi:hypothetical protein
LTQKLPICLFDAKTGILCSSCESRLAKGDITRADVEASKAIAGLSETVHELSRVSLRKAVEASGSYLLEFDQQDVQLIHSDPSVLAELEGALKGKVWAAGSGTSERRFLEDVLFPAKVLTVNTVWRADGGKRAKVIVPARRSERRITDFGKLREAVMLARGIDLMVETEREAGLLRVP